ncbi:DUF411 domain-containing protein [Rhizobium setariae]|uniref:DUF411 domain-containing protein n=1 Tax=Rhizobium setariae TaxID=2801340 RepID=UPI003CCF6C38
MTRRNILLSGLALSTAALGSVKASASPKTMTIYKDPNCGCCHLWGKAMADAGFLVKTVDLDDLSPIKTRFGISEQLQGCHTAEIDGYFLEGHVPLKSVTRLLLEKPALAGLAVPGMPAGSLGMGDEAKGNFEVLAVPKVKGAKLYVYDAIRPRV